MEEKMFIIKYPICNSSVVTIPLCLNEDIDLILIICTLLKLKFCALKLIQKVVKKNI